MLGRVRDAGRYTGVGQLRTNPTMNTSAPLAPLRALMDDGENRALRKFLNAFEVRTYENLRLTLRLCGFERCTPEWAHGRSGYVTTGDSQEWIRFILAQEASEPAIAAAAAVPTFGWQPFETVPRDGSRVDFWNGTHRLLGFRFVRAEEVNSKFAPGGVWEHLAQDGFRHSSRDEPILVEASLTHWRLSDNDRPV